MRILLAIAALVLSGCAATADVPVSQSSSAPPVTSPSAAVSPPMPSSTPAPSGTAAADDTCTAEGQYVVVYVLPDGKRGDLTLVASCKRDAEMQAYDQLPAGGLVVAIYAL